MGKFKLAFGIHNHQPVGNFEAVFEEAHQRAYLPFLKLVSSHDVSISLHQSGILWNWQKRVHPEFFEVVRGMIDRGQVELMTGGFYEPILHGRQVDLERSRYHQEPQSRGHLFPLEDAG